MIHFGKNGQNFVIIDTNRAMNLELTRVEAKALARFLMIELNIVEFYLNDGRPGHVEDIEFQKLLLKRWGQIIKLTE